MLQSKTPPEILRSFESLQESGFAIAIHQINFNTEHYNIRYIFMYMYITSVYQS